MSETLDTYAITSLAKVKLHLDIQTTDTTQDEILTRFINAATYRIEGFIDRKILTRSFTEYQDGRGESRILLAQWPAAKPSQLWIDQASQFTTAGDQLDVADYDLDVASNGEGIGVQLLRGRFFRSGRRNIKIVYNAGYAVTPPDIEDAAIWTVEYLYSMRSDRRIGVSQKGKNQETTTFNKDLPDFVVGVLEGYRRLEFSTGVVSVENI